MTNSETTETELKRDQEATPPEHQKTIQVKNSARDAIIPPRTRRICKKWKNEKKDKKKTVKQKQQVRQ